MNEIDRASVAVIRSEQGLTVYEIHVPVTAVHCMLPGRADDLPPAADHFFG